MIDWARRILDLYANGVWSTAIESDFAEWFLAPNNKEEKERLAEELWESIPAEECEEARRALKKIKKILGHLTLAKNVRRRRLGLIAAAVSAILIIGSTSVILTDRKPEPADMELMAIAAADSILNTKLPDNSEVWLNRSSSLKYGETADGARYAELSGEAYFDVAHVPDSRFEVRTPRLLATVRGTKLNVSISDTHTKVILYVGRVEVAAGGRSVDMPPGHILTYMYESGEVILEELSDPSADWRRGGLGFIHDDITTILRRIADFYNVSIDVPEQGLCRDPLSIKFEGTETINDVLYLLHKLSGRFTYRKEGDSYVIIPQ